MLQQFTWPQVDISPCSSKLFYYTHHSNLQLDKVSVLVPTRHANDSTLLGSTLFYNPLCLCLVLYSFMYMFFYHYMWLLVV